MRTSRWGPAAAVLLALAVAGCGAGRDGTGVATAGGAESASVTPSPSSNADKSLQFTRCMREHGIDVQDPEGGNDGRPRVLIPEGTDRTKADAALAACKKYEPSGGDLAAMDPERLEQLRQLAKCMRENGVPEFPDPTEKGLVLEKGSGIDPDDPKVKAAQKACDKYAPAGGRGGSGADRGPGSGG